MKKGKIIIIVAPSGTGKSTLILRLKKDFPELLESISYTTRPMRPGDESGVQYFFIQENEFLKMKEEGEFIEWAKVHNNYYGTSKKFVEEKINNGISLLFDLDVQGTDAFKEYFKDEAEAIFIKPPSIDILRERLIKRATDSMETIETRLSNARHELTKQDEYDHKVVNDDLEVAYHELKDLFNKILRG